MTYTRQQRRNMRRVSRALRQYGDSLSPRREVVVIQKSTGGLGIGTVLFLIFLVLKLVHAIDWSWWWVFSPFWIPVALATFLWVVGKAINIILSRRS